MNNQISAQIKKLRANQALELSASKEKYFAEKLIGKTVEIIAETETENLIDGLTKNYVRVYFPADSKIKSGDIVKVKIEKIFRNGVFGNALN